ncbi:MAG: hypothetical protein B6242_01405 [Anaerolineaceae bacterium 4572_78]|nr:MAG: hypothetical protein B6242_01405 [Anaerolineaceae bacterium 4572_78]
MNNTTIKIIIAILISIFTVCVCCGGVFTWSAAITLQSSFIIDPDKVEAFGADIATYTMPNDYHHLFGMDILNMRMVVMGTQNETIDGMLITLMSIPEGEQVNENELKQQLQLAMQRQYPLQSLDLKFDTLENHIVNEEEIVFTVRKGTDSTNTAYQQISGLVTSNKGRVFVLIQGPETMWDETVITQFLESIQ